MAASKSRLEKAGGDRNAAIQGLLSENHPDVARAKAQLQSGDPAQVAAAQQWIDQKILKTTKGKYSGPLGKAVQFIGKAAPIASLAIPGLGVPLAAAIGGAGGLARGEGLGGALKGAALGGGGAALLGGQGVGGLGGAAGRAGDVLGNIKGTLGKLGISPARAAQFGLAGLGMIQGAKQQGQANELNQGLQSQLQQQYLAQDQLRRQALGRLQQPMAGIPGGAFGNPFGGR